MTDVSLGDRMKRYEQQTKTLLPRRTYTLFRLDGKAFHSYTRALEKPFDQDLIEAMNETARALCQEITGTVLAYVQSDEISLLVTDFKAHGTEPWMGGNLQKQVSISAARAAVTFNDAMWHPAYERGLKVAPALFDSRVWTIADPNEVGNYLIWRQRDCVKNSITMVAQSHFSHRELDGLNSSQRQELLFERKGINWNDTPDGRKRGRVVVKETYPGPEDSVRTRWVVQDAPHLSLDPGSWLSEMIPAMPVLPAETAD